MDSAASPLTAYGWQRRRCCIAVGAACATSLARSRTAEVSRIVVHNEPHLQHSLALLRAALKAGGMPVELDNAPQGNYRRSLYQIEHGHTHVDMATISQRRLQLFKAGKLRMVPIPLDRGLLGWRVNLLLRRDQDKLAGIRSAAQLRALTLGQNLGWPDIQIYRHAGIPVKEIKKWSLGEFTEQMEAGFIDLFPLGLEEALNYFLPLFQQRYPQLTADPHLLVHYPWFRFVWVYGGAETEALHAALVRGFDAIVASGEFMHIWDTHRSPPPLSAYANRTIIRMENPFFGDALLPARYRHLLLSPSST